MRNLLTIAALAAGLATAANATPTMRHHHAAKADNGSAAVRDLNEKSLQQASAGAPMASPTTAPAMSDSGMAAPTSGGMSNSSTMTQAPTDATPTAPTTPQ